MQVTIDPANENYPVWSPDGTRLAFTSGKGGAGNVWTVSAEGGEMSRVTSDSDSVSMQWAGGSFVSWSPHGEWIAFEAVRAGRGDLWAISAAAGGERRQLTSGRADDTLPSWSPDGQWVAFTSDGGGNPGIWVVPAAGGFRALWTGKEKVDSEMLNR